MRLENFDIAYNFFCVLDHFDFGVFFFQGTKNEKVSKTLSWLLRHGAEKEGLVLKPGGWAKLDDILKKPQFHKVKGSCVFVTSWEHNRVVYKIYGWTRNTYEYLDTRVARIVKLLDNAKMFKGKSVRCKQVYSTSLQVNSLFWLFQVSVDQVKQVVKDCPKQRFALQEEDGELYIRANQGHTIEVRE